MKTVFIPKAFRPSVPGGTLKRLKLKPFKTNNKSTTISTILAISSKEDLVARRFMEDASCETPVVHLYFDELGYTWDFLFSKKNLTFFTEEETIQPISIYHRHPGVDKEHPYFNKHLAFFEVMDIWNGNAIGQKRDHFHNTSKPFQIVHSLQKTKSLSVSVPTTYLIKGNHWNFIKTNKEKLIVKSCSNMRSIAATGDKFVKWNKESLNYLPSLFQDKIKGTDYRIHLLDKTLWPLAVTSKDHIDYRYSNKNALEYAAPKASKDLTNFCINVSNLESNRFIGLDFIQKGNKYYFLESNPGPGWSTFNHPSRYQFTKIFTNSLIQKKDQQK